MKLRWNIIALVAVLGASAAAAGGPEVIAHRGGLFDLSAHMIASAKAELAIWRGPGAMVEQSSAQIWDATRRAVRAALKQAGVEPSQVAGIGFDATCSLVVLGTS